MKLCAVVILNCLILRFAPCGELGQLMPCHEPVLVSRVAERAAYREGLCVCVCASCQT